MLLLLISAASASCPEVSWSTFAEAQALVDTLSTQLAELESDEQDLMDEAAAAGCVSRANSYEDWGCSPTDVQHLVDTYACAIDRDGVGAEGTVSSVFADGTCPYTDYIETEQRDLLLQNGDAGAPLQSLRSQTRSQVDPAFYSSQGRGSLEVGLLGGELWLIDRYYYDFYESSDYYTLDQGWSWTECGTSLRLYDIETPRDGRRANWTLETPEHSLSLGTTVSPDSFHGCYWTSDDWYVSYVLDGVTGQALRSDLSPVTDMDGDGALAEVSDCDDLNAAIHPCASDDTCDGVDDDCDGLIDDDVRYWYLDQDGDGYGAGELVERCDESLSGSARGDDCDDGDPSLHPGAADVNCDGVDLDCDGLDEGIGWTDADGDGYAGTWDLDDCAALSEEALDCADRNGHISPGALEVCDDVDNDCDGLVDLEDDSLTDATLWHPDEDGDGAGSTEEVWLCEGEVSMVENSDDCDDTDPSRHLGAEESCDGLDNDCDAEVDEEVGCAEDSGAAAPEEDGRSREGGKSAACANVSAAPPLPGLALLCALAIRRRGPPSPRRR
jgi:Putative metal-binding motif